MILVRVCHLSNGKDLPHRVIGGLRDDPYEVFFNHLFFLVFKISFVYFWLHWVFVAA